MTSPRGAGQGPSVAAPDLAVKVVAAPPLLPPGPSAPPTEAALVAQLGESIRLAAALGDIDTVRALHATLARVLGQPPSSHEASGVRGVGPTRNPARRGAR
ncbi:hypothetical protein WMF18_28905 [Sorangium sp. So ce315]|uniref:hypothetical protein n=1 Tax=Sorangium sp. So ce315 TaxID=3133299 RepID=UPI003F61FA23